MLIPKRNFRPSNEAWAFDRGLMQLKIKVIREREIEREHVNYLCESLKSVRQLSLTLRIVKLEVNFLHEQGRCYLACEKS